MSSIFIGLFYSCSTVTDQRISGDVVYLSEEKLNAQTLTPSLFLPLGHLPNLLDLDRPGQSRINKHFRDTSDSMQNSFDGFWWLYINSNVASRFHSEFSSTWLSTGQKRHYWEQVLIQYQFIGTGFTLIKGPVWNISKKKLRHHVVTF